VRGLLDSWQDGRIKLLLTALALHTRARHPDVFDRGRHTPLRAGGARSDHVVAYARELDGDACIVVLPRWSTRLADRSVHATGSAVWHDTTLALPPTLAPHRVWRNALTGGEATAEAGRLRVAELFDAVPFALLELP
jgi:(1->4)-alpha-D-glucan 1-alpha-D-glucosylmutase